MLSIIVDTPKKKFAMVCGNDLACSVVSEVVDVEGHARYTTYGLKVQDELGATHIHIRDVSTNKLFVQNFAKLCVDNEVALCHVMDLLMDSLP